MYLYLLPEIAHQRREDLRRLARHYGAAGTRSHRPMTAARTTLPGDGSIRSKPRILVALLQAAFHKA